MPPTILTPDSELSFPDFTLLRASAGSGKTRALAHRYMQFVLSDTIEKNALTGILAITFSNNAAREMKQRILTWLKAIHTGNEEHLAVLHHLTGIDHDNLKERAGDLVDRILDNYSDFQVRTIDSFTASIFRSSALEFGISPQTEILLNKDQLIDHAFETFFRNLRPGSPESDALEKIIDYIILQKHPDSRYPWDPTAEIVSVFKKLYGRLSSLPGDAEPEDYSAEIADTFASIKDQIRTIDEFITANGLEYNRVARFDRALDAARSGDMHYAVGRQHRSNLIKKGAMNKEEFERWNSEVNELRDGLNILYARLTVKYARSYFNPHLVNFRNFSAVLDNAKRERNRIFIDDIGKKLSAHLTEQVIPYVYLMLGDTIHHYLIDEFQDTSPLQWADLVPLIDNSLSQGGSLFAVGDTKQAIYKFRGADFKIMKHLEEARVFPSADALVKDLDTNYRSDENILRFNETFFNTILEHEEYGAAARLSGLDHHTQQAAPKKKNKGYAESIVYRADDREEDPQPERRRIINTINDALQRGYSFRDIAVLTFKNKDVTTISTWLSEANIQFVSFSNLDVRNRKITGELISLLQFLNSPVDDLALASFCLGDICRMKLGQDSIRYEDFIQFINRTRNDAEMRTHPLYKNLQRAYPDFWNRYFERIFTRVGHLSIYDLTHDIYKTFALYDSFPDEEAALTRFIEAIKDFESEGINSLRAFLDHVASEDTESEWNIDTPETINAVRLMTVHKAKGLGFPVVIIPLYSDHRMREDFYIDQTGTGPRLLYLNKEIAGVDPELEQLYLAHRLAGIADYLNGLYVACTRAEEEMYLIGIPPKREGEESIFSMFPSETFGEKTRRKASAVTDLPQIPAYHHTHPGRFDFGDTMPLNINELRRGEIVHEILSKIEFADDLQERLRHLDEIADDPEIGNVTELLTTFINIPEIKDYFERTGDRVVRNEFEITDASGRLFRVDRLVIDRDVVTAIDFKTGDDQRQGSEHKEQVRNYMKILADIYPAKTIRGIIAYVDANKIRVIE